MPGDPPRERLADLPAPLLDAAMAGVLAVLLVCARAIETHGADRHAAAGYTLTLLAAITVLGRRRWPVATLLASLGVALLAIVLAPPTGAISLPFVVAVYSLAQSGGRLPAATGAVLGGAGLALARGLVQYKGWSDARTAVEPVLSLAALFLGWAVSNHRAYIREIEDRALRAERTREEEARRRVDAERLRIARELHDVLAHGIATISVQAGVAAHLLRRRPDQAEQALGTIKATSKQALRELRGILGVLREAEHETPARNPAPGLAQLEALVASAAGAGLKARVVVSGDRRQLPGSVELAAYRIVQESLTNVVRHAGRASNAVVSIVYAREELRISVEDDGLAQTDERPPATTPGHGILGMRERAAALGGELAAGARAHGGFRVRARLPIAAGPP